MSELSFTIRDAQESDAAAIGRIHVDTWRETYAGLVPDRVLVGMSDRRYAMQWARVIRRRGPKDVILVADGPPGPVGFASAGKLRSGGSEAEIQMLYVDPNYQGQNIGRGLLCATFERLGAMGFTAAVLWVVAANPARFFYEAMGGKRTVEKTETMWGQPLPQFGYRWADLAAPFAPDGPCSGGGG